MQESKCPHLAPSALDIFPMATEFHPLSYHRSMLHFLKDVATAPKQAAHTLRDGLQGWSSELGMGNLGGFSQAMEQLVHTHPQM